MEDIEPLYKSAFGKNLWDKRVRKNKKMSEMKTSNPLGTEKISKLMVKFAVPSIIAMLVSALYNIVDQLFIGQAVGTLGNAATNVAFPLSTSCIAMALLFGIGGASNFNLSMGRGEKDKAACYAGNAAGLLVGSGLVLLLITQLFLTPLLKFFGAPGDVLPYAETYVRITSIGFPCLILTTGGCHLIRADGSPKMSMLCNLIGAVVNTVLDAIFVLGFRWGMAGAALATIIGQIISAAIVVVYLMHYKTVHLGRKQLKVKPEYAVKIMALGTASFFNQVAMMIVQIVLNKSLTYYGALSEYGSAIPLACAGIVMKIGQLFFSVIIGISQGTQPIESFNYGAKKYGRVREAYGLAVRVGAIIAIISFAVLQLFPKQILALFGTGTDAYFKFGVKFLRVYLFFTCVNFLQPITSTFFTSIGKPQKGTFLALTRQIVFLLPLIVILPLILGIDGIMYAAPIADFLAAVIAIVMAFLEFREMEKPEQAKE